MSEQKLQLLWGVFALQKSAFIKSGLRTKPVWTRETGSWVIKAHWCAWGALSGPGGPIQQTSCRSAQRVLAVPDLPREPPVGTSASERDVLDKRVSIHGDPTWQENLLLTSLSHVPQHTFGVPASGRVRTLLAANQSYRCHAGVCTEKEEIHMFLDTCIILIIIAVVNPDYCGAVTAPVRCKPRKYGRKRDDPMPPLPQQSIWILSPIYSPLSCSVACEIEPEKCDSSSFHLRVPDFGSPDVRTFTFFLFLLHLSGWLVLRSNVSEKFKWHYWNFEATMRTCKLSSLWEEERDSWTSVSPGTRELQKRRDEFAFMKRRRQGV